jgi:hypothetical protein
MAAPTPLSILISVLGILACGALGAFAGFGLIHAIGVAGTFGAIIAVAAGMVVATAAWTLGATLLKKAGLLR